MTTFPMLIQTRKMMRKMQTTTATWMASSYQIKARVTKRIVVMENLPFLKQNEPQSRNAPSESDWPQRPPPHYMQDDEPRGAMDMAVPPKGDVFESLKANPMALVLLGIVIGALLVNMRPVVIKS
jgi:hypothetical protein